MIPAHTDFSLPRADGQQTPVREYLPAASASCPPFALISHGAGGSETGYVYLASALQAAGWRVWVLGHVESGLEVLQASIKAAGFRDGVFQLATDSAAHRARLLDIDAALAAAPATSRRLLLGHSMGAATVMLEAGAQHRLAVQAGADRFAAYVALSPHGPGTLFPSGAWRGIHKPMLLITGPRDEPFEGDDWRSRLLPFEYLPPGGKWLTVVEDATHMHFAGIGVNATRTTAATAATVLAFLHALDQTIPTPAPAIADTLIRCK